jgi:hypothetical protein
MPPQEQERNLLRLASAEGEEDTVEEAVVVQRNGRHYLFGAGVMVVTAWFLLVGMALLTRARSQLHESDSGGSSNKFSLVIPTGPPKRNNASRVVTVPQGNAPKFRGVVGPVSPWIIEATTSTTTGTTTGTQTSTITTTTTPHLFAPEAPLHEFYMYRAIAEGGLDHYSFGNLNTGNLDGVIWYLMNEVVTMYTQGPRCPRKFNISKIHRFKVMTRATRELFSENLNMGARFSFDRGVCAGRCFPQNMCTGKGDCDYHYGKYGYVVGCNNFYDHSPFPEWDTPAKGGIWYSLPLAGRCNYPTGAHNCTWSYEDAGEIDVKELEATTPGDGNCCDGTCTGFWDDQLDEWRTTIRVQKAQEMFRLKYPTQPTVLGYPVCDFHPWAWYEHDGWKRRDPWAPYHHNKSDHKAEPSDSKSD